MQLTGWTIGLFCLFVFLLGDGRDLYQILLLYRRSTTGRVYLSSTHVLIKSVTNGNASCRNSESLENLIKMENKFWRYPVLLPDTQ